MPPKAKFTKEEVIAAGLALCQEKGFEALTARELAGALHTSPRPLFTLYSSMEELTDDVRAAAYRYYLAFLEEKMSASENRYKASGMGYILFAKEEKNLFRELFMKRPKATIVAGEDEGVLSILTKRQGISMKEAAELHFNIWMYVHGIATMIATGFKDFSDSELEKMLYGCYTAFTAKYKKEN